MQTAEAFERKDLVMLEQLKESVEAGMKLCGELLESFVLVFRSRKELLAEIEERRKIRQTKKRFLRKRKIKKE